MESTDWECPSLWVGCETHPATTKKSNTLETNNHISDFFKDLKVVELAGVLAGPAAGSFFAELGAKVIKVENKRAGGDVTRSWQAPGESSEGPSAYYSSANYAKEVRLLDLTQPDDLKTLHNLILDADIVLANHRERTAKKFHLTYADLSKSNPGLIYVQLDGYVDGDRPAYDVVLQAETGWISMTGIDSSHPAKLPVALIDILAGHQMREATLLALIKRMKTGKGSFVRVTLEQASLSALANQATNYLMSGRVAEPIGTLHPNIAPYGDWFETADGKRLVLAIGSDRQFAALTKVLGRPEWARDPRFENNNARLCHRKVLAENIAEAMANFSAHRLASELDEAGVPYGFVLKLDEVLFTPAAQAMLRHEEIDGFPTTRLSSLAYSTTFLKPTSSARGSD